MRRLFLMGSLLASLSLIAVPSATANTILLDVTNVSNGALATGTTYGQVDFDLNGTSIDVTVLMVAGYGLHNADFAFNGTNGGTVSVSNVSYSYAGTDPGTPVFTASGYGNMDGFGNFVAGFTGGSGSSSDYTMLKFTVSTTAVGGFTSADQLLAGNNKGASNYFSGQIAALGVDGCTGFVGNHGSTNDAKENSKCSVSVPDGGSTLGLLGFAILGLGLLRRRMM